MTTGGGKTTRRVYSAEELHRLRGSQSKPNLGESIEEHDGEDAELVKAIVGLLPIVDLQAPSKFTRRLTIASASISIRFFPVCTSFCMLPRTLHNTMDIDMELEDSEQRFYENLLDSPAINGDSWSPPSPELTRSPEHVLRGTKSFTARSYRSRASTATLRVPSNRSNIENYSVSGEDITRPTGLSVPISGRVLGEIAPNGQFPRGGPFRPRPSPTPSLKKKKAEAIVKAHGSPQHIRVTAGGRIVPSDQSPLCAPRYGYSAIQTNGGLIKFAPNHQAGADEQWAAATHTEGTVAQDINGQLFQIVEGTILPLKSVDGPLVLYKHAPNLNFRSERIGANAAGPAQHPINLSASHPREHVVASEPSVASQVIALELEYSKLEHEQKELDKSEVIHGRTMIPEAKKNLVRKRRELVTNMDQVRKALKALKSQPPPNAPTSPRAMMTRQSTSPPGRHRLPPFLHTSNVVPQQTFPPYAATQPPQLAAPQFRPTPSPEEVFAGQWAVRPPGPPTGMFVPPSSFDGSMAAPPFSTYASAMPTGDTSAAAAVLSASQNSAHSLADALSNLKLESPRNHAVSIKAPEAKPGSNLKSGLNPMSPVYKPGVPAAADKVSSASATLTPLHELRPPTVTASEETISPAKQHCHLHSSSISSFETADFFPRNTREYSTRQHAYAHPVEALDKKNTAADQTCQPVTPGHGSDWKPRAPDTGDYDGKVPPPGTPVFHSDATTQAPLPSNVNDTSIEQQRQLDVPNRDADNISPKNRRYVFVQEDPSTQQDEELLDWSHKSRAWLEGYQLGLLRLPVNPKEGNNDRILGYCAGLIKSEPKAESSSVAASNGSPVKTHSRRPTPQPRSVSRAQPPEHGAVTTRPPFESNTQSLDTLKQAVFAPQNENAVLTPSAEGPHVTEAPQNLGAWAKNLHSSPSGPATGSEHVPGHLVPKRAVPLSRQGIMSEGNNDVCRQDKVSSNARSSEGAGPYLQPSSNQIPLPASPTTSTRSIASSSIASAGVPDTGNRITSLTSIDANMYRGWPGSRIMTPNQWKGGNAFPHAAGLATGYFAAAQFDGTNESSLRVPGQLTGDVTGAPQRVGSDSGMSQGGRFREGSLDGITSPPMSPTISPNGTPVKDSGKKKNPSPAKAKFEHVAEKMGIKIASAEKPDAGVDGSLDPSGARGKRSAWRDL